MSYVTFSDHYLQSHISFLGEKVAYFCATLKNDVDESEDSHLFCPHGNKIQITEATYGKIDDGSNCNMTHEKIPCQSRNGSKTTKLITT